MKNKMEIPDRSLSSEEKKALIEYVAAKLKDRVLFPRMVENAREFLRNLTTAKQQSKKSTYCQFK